MEIQTNINYFSEKCIYDANILVVGAVSFLNVALLAHEVSCSASSEISVLFSCYNALKGNSNPDGFASNNEGIAFWLNITLAKTYTLTHARLMPRFHLYDGMKSAQLMYANEVIDQVRLLIL